MRLLLGALLTLVVVTSGVARAETDTEKADRLFNEAAALKEAGRSAEACAKFDEAFRLNPSTPGGALTVGRCHEEANRIATALVYFTQARDLAREGNSPPHLAKAEEHIAKLEPLVPHLSIAFAEILTNTKLVIDDKVYPITGANDIRVDPGTRHIVVTAPGRLPYDTTVQIRANEKKTVDIPKLKPPVTVSRGRRTIGKIVTFSGAALVGTGIGLGFVANSRYQGEIDNGNCTPGMGDMPPQCNPDGYKTTSNALTLGTVGTVVGITGAVAVGVGAYLWFFAPKEPSSQEHATVTFTPTVSGDSAGVAAVGRF